MVDNYLKVEDCFRCYLNRKYNEDCAHIEISQRLGGCLWASVIKGDLEKIVRGDECLTFPDIKKVLSKIYITTRE